MNGRWLKVWPVLAAVALLCGCLPTVSRQKTGLVHLVLDAGLKAKTILPTVSVDSYVIHFDNGPVVQSSVDTAEPSPVIELAVGTWDITVEGKDSEGQTVAQGSAVGVVVTGGDRTVVAIELVAQTGGSGTIDVTVSWPGSVGIDEVEVTVNEVAVDPGTVSGGERWVRYTEQKPSGSYGLCFDLKNGGVLRASVQEAVQVYDNLSSSATIALTEADFTLVPEAPDGLVVEEGLGVLELSWVDNSAVEMGYVVERSVGDNLSYVVLDSSLPANAEFYSDSTVSTGQSYYYRVKATNVVGGSGYSNEVVGVMQPPAPGGGGVLSFSQVTINSIRISWQKAADNVSAQGVLEYKVVRSLSDNVGTVQEAESSGGGREVVLDWSADIGMVQSMGLASGTLYYFNVLVRDEAGNKNAYLSNSQATLAAGELSFTLTVCSPGDEPITFDHAQDVTVAPDTVLTVSIAEGFDSYEWVLYGLDLSSQASNSIDIDCQQLWPGVHRLALYVSKNSLLYSNTLRFRIEN